MERKKVSAVYISWRSPRDFFENPPQAMQEIKKGFLLMDCSCTVFQVFLRFFRNYDSFIVILEGSIALDP
jgi:hypothetical protein